jgi:hypothetical protein
VARMRSPATSIIPPALADLSASPTRRHSSEKRHAVVFCIRLFEAATYLLLRFHAENRRILLFDEPLDPLVENAGSHDRSSSTLKT